MLLEFSTIDITKIINVNIYAINCLTFYAPGEKSTTPIRACPLRGQGFSQFAIKSAHPVKKIALSLFFLFEQKFLRFFQVERLAL